MTTTTEAMGPIDFLLIEFPNEKTDGHAADALADLVDAGTIRLLDLVVARKEGREVRYVVNDAQFARAVRQLATVGAAWDARLRRIKKIAELIQALRSTD